MFYGTGTRPEKVLTIRRVRDFEDRILCARTMPTYVFFAITFFLKVYSTKRRNRALKLCEKKIGHHTRLGENNLLLIWPTHPQRKPLGLDRARARARANDAKNYAQ